MVSIITYYWAEYEKYFKECLQSIDLQTYKDFEVIVEKEKTDLSSARNSGIRRAKGDWILTLDVDDLILPDFLEKTVGKGDIVATSHQDNGVIGRVSQTVELKDFLQCNQIIAGSLFKKEIWEKIDGFDEKMTDGYEDWDFWIRALKAGYKVVTIEEPLYVYRKHPDSMISKTVQKDADIRKYIYSKL